MTPITPKVKTRAEYLAEAEEYRQRSLQTTDGDGDYWRQGAIVCALLANAAPKPAQTSTPDDKATALLVALVSELHHIRYGYGEHDETEYDRLFHEADKYVRTLAHQEEAVEFAETALSRDYEAVCRQRDELLEACAGKQYPDISAISWCGGIVEDFGRLLRGEQPDPIDDPEAAWTAYNEARTMLAQLESAYQTSTTPANQEAE